MRSNVRRFLLLASLFACAPSQDRDSPVLIIAVASQNDRETRLLNRTMERAGVSEVRLIAYPTTRDAFAHTLKGDADVIVGLDEPMGGMREFFVGPPSVRVLRQPSR